MFMPPPANIISRHRLPQPYRGALVMLWLLPSLILLITLLLLHGERALAALLPLIILSLPALYIWREGVDVLSTGIIRRIHLPTRHYSYARLTRCTYDEANGVLRVWDERSEIALECRVGHLTDFDRLRATLTTEINR